MFQTIVIDSPWDWGEENDINQFGRARPDYATMQFEEILKCPVSGFAMKIVTCTYWLQFWVCLWDSNWLKNEDLDK